MKHACVIGWPISHSRSPLIHNYWLKIYQIEGIYDKFPVKPDNLAAFIASLQKNRLSGCNVTIPHKEAVFNLVRIADRETQRIGAVNTIFLDDGQPWGTNTDGRGFLANIISHIPDLDLTGNRILLLGAGGSAVSIIAILLTRGVREIVVANRTPERSIDLCERFGEIIKPAHWEDRDRSLPDCDILINTTPLGMTGQSALHINLELLPRDAIVADIVYSPLTTPLLKAARDLGHRIVPGLGMLLHQAVPGFELWFGRKPEVTSELYDLVACDIDPGYQR